MIFCLVSVFSAGQVASLRDAGNGRRHSHHHTAYGVNCTPCVPPLRGCKGPRSYTVPRKSQIAPRKSGDSAHRWRVSRNGAPQAGRRRGDGRRAGACRCRSLFPRRPSPPLFPPTAPPFRCERSEQRNPLPAWLSRGGYPLIPRKSQIVNRKSKKAATM